MAVLAAKRLALLLTAGFLQDASVARLDLEGGAHQWLCGEEYLSVGQSNQDCLERLSGAYASQNERCNGHSSCAGASDEAGCDVCAHIFAPARSVPLSDCAVDEHVEVHLTGANSTCGGEAGIYNGLSYCARGADEVHGGDVLQVSLGVESGRTSAVESLRNGTGISHCHEYRSGSFGRVVDRALIKYLYGVKTGCGHVMTKFRTVEPIAVLLSMIDRGKSIRLDAQGNGAPQVTLETECGRTLTVESWRGGTGAFHGREVHSYSLGRFMGEAFIECSISDKIIDGGHVKAQIRVVGPFIVLLAMSDHGEPNWLDVHCDGALQVTLGVESRRIITVESLPSGTGISHCRGRHFDSRGCSMGRTFVKYSDKMSDCEHVMIKVRPADRVTALLAVFDHSKPNWLDAQGFTPFGTGALLGSEFLDTFGDLLRDVFVMRPSGDKRIGCGLVMTKIILNLEPHDYVDRDASGCKVAFMPLDVPPPRGPLFVFGIPFLEKFLTDYDEANEQGGFGIAAHADLKRGAASSLLIEFQPGSAAARSSSPEGQALPGPQLPAMSVQGSFVSVDRRHPRRPSRGLPPQTAPTRPWGAGLTALRADRDVAGVHALEEGDPCERRRATLDLPNGRVGQRGASRQDYSPCRPRLGGLVHVPSQSHSGHVSCHHRPAGVPVGRGPLARGSRGSQSSVSHVVGGGTGSGVVGGTSPFLPDSAGGAASTSSRSTPSVPSSAFCASEGSFMTGRGTSQGNAVQRGGSGANTMQVCGTSQGNAVQRGGSDASTMQVIQVNSAGAARSTAGR